MYEGQLKYEGKAKRVYGTDTPGVVRIDFKDDATAFNAQKRGVIEGKGAINNAITAHLYPLLAEAGVPNHFLEQISATEQLVREVSIIPVEVIVRSTAAGSFAARLGLEEGLPLAAPVIEYCYKSDELGDPLVSDSTPIAMGWASARELAELNSLALAANSFLLGFFSARDLQLVDIKFEFGRLPDGTILLADEISPDTCRLWDTDSGERLDKDRFRRDLGGVEDAYRTILKRVTS